MKRTILAISCALAALLCTAQQQVVMTIAGEPVYKEEYDYNYNKNNTDEVVDKMTPREYAELYAAYRLKVRAAMDAHMDTLQSFKKEFRTYRDKQIRPLLVSDGDVEQAARDYYQRLKDELKGHDLIMPAHVFVRLLQQDGEEKAVAAKVRADSIYEVLKRGVEFGQVASECSDDASTARRGGVIGWISPGQTLPEFEDVAYTLKKGEMSSPVKSVVGYHIIKMMDRKELEPYDTLRTSILSYLERSGVRARLCKQMVDSVAKADGMTADEVMDIEAERLCRQDKDLAYLVQEYHDGLLLFEISSREVWEPAKKDTAGLERYFSQHRKEYEWDEPHYRGMAFTCMQKSQVKAVKKLLKKTPEREWISAVRKAFNKDSITVRMEKKLFVKGQNKTVDALVFKVKSKDNNNDAKYPYSGVYGKMLKSAPEQWTDVASRVIDGYQNERMVQYVKELRERYPVVINEEAFK